MDRAKQSERARRWRAKYPWKAAEATRKYRLTHLEQVRAKQRERERERRNGPDGDRIRELQRESQRRRSASNRAYSDARKLEASRCADFDKCGQAVTPDTLRYFHWDHVDPATKRFTVSKGYWRAPAAIREEIAKCVLRCARCHAERTMREGHTTAWRGDETPPESVIQLTLFEFESTEREAD